MPRESTERACLTFKSRQLAALKRLSGETGAPVAELARRAVDAFLTAHVAGHRRESDRAESRPGEPAPIASISD